jgi:hypothetical protein
MMNCMFLLALASAPKGHSPNLLHGLQGAANAATVIGVLVAAGAAFVAVASLRSQARSQQLTAIMTTNTLWLDVGGAVDTDIKLSRSTVTAIRRVYSELLGYPGAAVDTDQPATELVMRVPFIISGLLPSGTLQSGMAPNDEIQYLSKLRARTLAFGYVRTVLQDRQYSPAWATSAMKRAIERDLAALDNAMTTWVNRLNEVAELYEGNLLDRRRFVGKRSVAIIQQLFAAEPYILWRNSTTPGRWGLRVLGLGSEARRYHWRSPLQRAAIRLRVDPRGYQRSLTYPGLCERLGWIIGPGHTASNVFAWGLAQFRLKAGLGSGYTWGNKARQNEFISMLPTSVSSGLTSTSISWRDVAADPATVRNAVILLEK